MRQALAIALALAAALAALGAGAATSPSSSAARAAPRTVLRAAQAPRSQLVRARTVRFRGFRVARFSQVGGYPVLDGQLTVVSGPDEPARVAAEDTAALPPQLGLAALAGRVSRTRAIAIARRARRAGRSAPASAPVRRS